jgi:hypothetical protein
VAVVLSRNQRVRLAGSLAVVFAAVGLWIFVRPAWDQYVERAGELESLIEAMPPEQPRVMSLGQLIRRISATRAALDAQRSRFPITENVSQLLIETEKILSGSEITRFYPVKVEEVHLPSLASADVRVMQQRILVDAEGDFFALRDFLAGLERFRHPVQVRSFEIGYLAGPSLDNPGLLSLRFTLAAFLLQSPAGGSEAEQRALEEVLAEIQAADTGPTVPLPVASDPGQLVGELPTFIPGLKPLPPPALVSTPVPAPPKPVRTAPPAPMRIADGADMPPRNWFVVGIVYAKDSHTAVIQDATRQLAVSRGDEVERGWFVDRIDPRRVIVRKGRNTYELAYPDGQSPDER